MKQLIICIILAVSLVGCGEKPKFSINENDTSETYVNNSLFKPLVFRVKISNNSDFTKIDNKGIYQFSGAPESVNGIKINDLNVLGGTIDVKTTPEKKALDVVLIIRGKKSSIKLEDRISKLKGSTCQVSVTGESRWTICTIKKNQDTTISLMIRYEPLSDIASFSYKIYER